MKLSNSLPLPNHWSYQSEEVKEVELLPGSSEYKKVKSYLEGNSKDNLSRITRIQNPYLYHRYLLRKLEYSSRGIPFIECNLVHATAERKIPSIISDNLDWRLVQRAKFGQGVSFSNSSIYANKQCARSNGSDRAMILAKVLVGAKYPGNQLTKIPPKGFDTTTGNRGFVYVKYYDDEFYPEYVAYYSDLLSLRSLRTLRIY